MQENFNDWALVSLSPLPLSVRVVSVVALVVAAVFVLRSYRTASGRFSLTLWRALGALLVVGFLIEPALQLRAVRSVPSRLGVVVDRSLSMTLTGESGQKRYAQLLEFVKNSQGDIKRLEQDYILDWFDLEGPLATGELETAPAGETSDLLSALERVRDEGGGRPLAGIVLLSDGADSKDLEGTSRGSLSQGAIERLKRLEIPVSTVNVVAADAFKDVAILDVLADEFAFVKNTIEITVTLEATGFDDTTVPLTLRQENQVLVTREVTLEAGKTTTVTLKTKPDKIGEFVYRVSVPVLDGEAVAANNQQSFVVQVIRDKIRVLQVAGRPSWDERFLRQHLKENPNVDLISFFILRTPTDLTAAPENELSLIPFPVDQLFTTELSSFDVLIFQNFDYRPYQMVQYLPNIAKAVQEGLGFVMIGGEQSFGNGGYLGTVLEDTIPLRSDASELVESTVAPALTEAGRRHPVTSLGRGNSNDKVWRELPGWSGFNRTGGLTTGATALVVHPSQRDGTGSLLPLVAVADVGEGRTLALGTDSLWRWRFSSQRDGGAAQRAYHKFWSNALRWLVRDPETSRVQVRPEQRRFTFGKPTEITFSVRGRDYRPIPFADLRVQIERTEGEGGLVRDVTTGESGVLRHKVEGLEPGAYRVSAVARQGGRRLGKGTAVFVVDEESLELTRGTPRPDLLARIAESTSGEALSLRDDVWSDVDLVDPDVIEIDRRKNIELWDNMWALALGLVLLGLDWATRRRHGFL